MVESPSKLSKHGAAEPNSAAVPVRSKKPWSPDAWLGGMSELLGSELRCLYFGVGDGASHEPPPGVSTRWIDLTRFDHGGEDVAEVTLADAAGEPLLEVSTFDVIILDGNASVPAQVEHLLHEAVRYLKPNGVLLIAAPIEGSTGDDVIAPPAFWGARLRSLDFERALRLNAESGVLEWLGGRGEAEHWGTLREAFLEEGMQSTLDIQVEGESLLWTPIEIADTECEAFYLLNPNKAPLNILCEYRAKDESHPDLFLNDLKLRYLGGGVENDGWRHRWSATTLTPGGCRLLLAWCGASRDEASLRFRVKSQKTETFLKSLPFDHYQRYRLTADAAQALVPAGSKILDVGGALGFFHLFAPERDVTMIDLSWDDSPCARIYGGGRLPWPDQAFDAVVCVDTLEHVPPQERKTFLAELRRVSSSAVILCCPFDESNVAEAESALREFLLHRLGRSDRFLDEHRDYTLPNLGEVSDNFEQEGWSVTGLPNGYLPRWLAMQFVQFIFGEAPELFESRAQVNALYNDIYYASDNRFPSYRIALAATREPLSESHRKALYRFISTEVDLPSGEMWGVASLTANLAQFDLLREKEAYLQRKSQQVDRLLDHIHNLEESLQDARRHAENLSQSLAEQQNLRQGLREHIQNLDEQESQRQTHLKNLDEHIRNLENLIAERDNHARNLQIMLDEQMKRVSAMDAKLAEVDSLFEKVGIRFVEIPPSGSQGKMQDKMKEEQELVSQSMTLEQLAHGLTQLARGVYGLCEQLELPPDENLPRSLNQASGALRQVLDERQELHEELARLRGAFFVRVLRVIGLVPKPSRDGA